jgi:rare lipoprotein A
MVLLRRLLLGLPAVLLVSCTTPLPDTTKKPALYNPEPVHVETGIASWYRDKRTASGERFHVNALTAAHRKLPFGTMVRVVDLKTNKSIIVRINDRGPYIRGRIIDLTVGAARQLGTYDRGIAKVRVEVLRQIPILTKPNLHERAAPKKRRTE